MRVCLFIPFIRQICRRTSRSHTEGKVTQDISTISFAALASIFISKRVQPSLSLVDCEVGFCCLL